MLRMFRLTNLSRALTIVVALACIALVLTPPLPQARGEGLSLAVVAPENSAHVSATVLDQIARAMYDGAVGTGHYDVKAGGPIKVEAASTGDILPAALGAASRVNADHVLVADVISVANGKLLYRMSIYKVNPVTFGRSQVFSQAYPPSDPRVLASQFGTSLATLEAPRTYTGTIYALTPSITADTGSEEGFRIGQRFNVVRNGKKVAEAQIVQISEISAGVDILNPSAGYQAQIGDRLISQEQGPNMASGPPSGNSNSFLGVLGVLVGVGAALVAIGNHGSAASVQCPPPTPSGAGCSTAPPSGGTPFTVIATSQGGSPSKPVLTFTFSKPVSNAATFPFSGTTQLYITSQVGISGMPTPPQPIAGFGGATGSFDPTGTILTITVTGTLTTGDVYFIFFTSQITATDSSMLTAAGFRYPSSGTCCESAAHQVRVIHQSPVSNGNAGGTNGSGANNHPPHQPGGH